MTLLHILNKSGDHPRFSACLATVRSRDALLLTGNAVIALADADVSWPGAMVYALDEDIESRGLGLAPFSVAAERIDYNKFVALTLEADKVVSW